MGSCRRYLLPLAAVLALLVAAAPAQAAKRKVPFGFFGTVFSTGQAEGLSQPALDAQMARMARSGVEVIRYSVAWYGVEPQPGAYDFAGLDRLVAAAARRHIEVMPTVTGSPRWASSRSDRDDYYLYAPRDPQTYANFLRTLVGRYGPRGRFWATSGTPKLPIRNWQFWNEPGADFFWATQPWAPAYVRMIKPAYRAVHAADPGATTLLGGLVGVGQGTPWGQLGALYRAGAKGYFDVVPAHYYSAASSARETTDQTVELIRRMRAQMRTAGDKRRQIWFTEMTWTAAEGRIPRSDLLGFETTPKGQAARLKSVFTRLARDRRKLNVGQVLWFEWATSYSSALAPGAFGRVSFQFAGLNRIAGANITPMPVLDTYTRIAARFEGCRKTADARRCR
jgi:polysaccharide biosynthesis protein PslG